MIFHIAEAERWAEAETEGLYRGSTLGVTVEEVGFIHCSHRHQVEDVANTFYRGRHGLLLLVIDPAKVTAEIREEPSADGAERFPHIYGPLNLGAVIGVRPFPADEDGRFSLRH